MSSTAPNLSTVPSVDLDRYLGRWYVIAYTPNFLENGKVATSDNYARRADGKLQADFAFRKGSLDAPEREWKGVAKIVNRTSNAEWKVQLFWPLWADYLILELDPEYRWAVVASRGGKWVWVLARETSLPPAIYADLQQRVAARGLDARKLALVPQRTTGR
jgi:apolipoprotein D and lipocalin family protein